MLNNILDNTLKETWEIKENFYENYKELSLREIILKIENKKYELFFDKPTDESIQPKKKQPEPVCG